MTTTRDTRGSARQPDPRRGPAPRAGTPRPPHRRPAAGNQSQDDPSPEASKAVVAVRKIFAAETAEYFLLLGTTLFMVIFGLVMVLSSSAIESHVSDDDFFARFARQGMWALLGLPVMLIVARVPASFWKKWAWQAIAISIVLQLLVFVPGLGYGTGGNRNWLHIGSFTAQPSELVKLALVVWLAVVLTLKSDRFDDWKHVALPIAPVAGLAIGLVLLGNDLGTVIVLVAIVLGAMFFAGVRLRIIATAIVGMAVVAFVAIKLSDSRSDRINAWLDGCSNPDDMLGDCYQTIHGWWALADGGVFGVGLGNSAAKWSWLPEASNDFIFAIIGEELGLIGCVLVLALFVVLAVCFIRIIRMQTELFGRVAVSAVMVWIIGQAFVNIAVVLGLLPVLGVPLPLMSAGGSALITTLAAIGIVLSLARQRPERPLARDFAAPSRAVPRGRSVR